MQAAVNCLVNEARRKLVWASILVRVRRSVTPYPRRNATRPLRTTSTAAPGALLDFSGAKIASIWLGETWPEAKTVEEKIAKPSSAAASVDFKRKALEFGCSDLRHDNRRRTWNHVPLSIGGGSI